MDKKVYLLLDRSGSMETMWNEAINSILTYAEGLDKETLLYIAAFDNMSHDTVFDGFAWRLTRDKFAEIKPRGGTPLFDSAMRLFNLAFADRPKRAVILTMTDGEENSSHGTNRAQIKAAADTVRDKGWELIFLGANFDKVGASSAAFGNASGKHINMAVGKMGQTMSATACSTQSYLSGSAATMDFTPAEQAEAATPGAPKKKKTGP